MKNTILLFFFIDEKYYFAHFSYMKNTILPIFNGWKILFCPFFMDEKYNFAYFYGW